MQTTSIRLVGLFAAILSATACNAIFGIEEGTPDDAGAQGGGGGASTGPGGLPCPSAGTASCADGVLTVCDGAGHTQPSVPCGAVALCDAVGQRCNDFGRLSVGVQRACAIDDDHGVHCWGDNRGSPLATGSLQLGDAHAMFPRAELITGVQAWQIGVADVHQCALQKNGDVACWGDGLTGVLGTAPSDGPSLNAKVDLTLPAVEVGVAVGCSCARLSDGSVWCWGAADQGCLGTNSAATGPQWNPTRIALGGPAVQIRIGDGETTPSCALLASGEVSCWGQAFTPTLVPAVIHATAITVGVGKVFVLGPEGVSWSTPVPPSGGSGPATLAAPVPYPSAVPITKMAAGDSFCTVDANGALSCATLDGDSGYLTSFPKTTPTTAPAGSIAEIAAGYGETYSATVQCLRLGDQPFATSIHCWGDDAQGDLGVGGPEYPMSPQSVAGLPQAVTSLSCGQLSTGVVLADGSPHYWGNGEAYVGYGNSQSTPSPSLLAMGADNTLLRTGDSGALAYALKTGGGAPTLVSNGAAVTTPKRLLTFPSVDFVDAVPHFTDVGLLSTGQVIVFADSFTSPNPAGNDSGLFGDGTTTTPAGGKITAVTLPEAATAISVYSDDYNAWAAHMCAILASGKLYCWGSNSSGESAVSSQPATPTATVPNQVSLPSVTEPIVSVAAGAGFTCATDGPGGTGQVFCWGANDHGQLGQAEAPDYTLVSATPKPVVGIGKGGGLVPAVGVAVGFAHACAWLQDQTVRCWGSNDYGQLGDGSYDDRGAPVTVMGLGGVTSVSAGSGHTCALHADGSVSCWGSSYQGEVGAGMNGQFPSPTPVQNLL